MNNFIEMAYLVVCIITTLLLSFTAIYSLRIRRSEATQSFVLFSVSVALLCMTFLLTVLPSSDEFKMVLERVNSFVKFMIAPLFLIFSKRLNSERSFHSVPFGLFLWLIPFAGTAAMLIPPLQFLISENLAPNAQGFMDHTHGVLFHIILLHSTICFGMGIYNLMNLRKSNSRLFRRQSISLTVTAVLIWINMVNHSVFHDIGLLTNYFNNMPLTVLVASVVLTIALRKYHLLDIMPVEISSISPLLRDGVVILDWNKRIIDYNDGCAQILEIPENAHGMNVVDFVKENKVLIEDINSFYEGDEQCRSNLYNGVDYSYTRLPGGATLISVKNFAPYSSSVDLEALPNDSLLSKVLIEFEVNQVYKLSALRLDYLSRKIGTNRSYLSRFINETLGIDFTHLVSIYRIEEFKKLALLPEYDGVSLNIIAKEAGFASRSSFHAHFKNIMKQTPAEWIADTKKTV